jgi:hypothetical protein
MMRAFGYEKPLVVGEYNAPWPNLYPEATAAMERAAQAGLAGLYEHMAELPPQLQMFMRGCPKELEDKRDRINCRELVMRNLLALSAGVRRTVCWNLAPDIPGYEDPLSVMDLLFGKLPLLGYQGTELTVRHPPAGACGSRSRTPRCWSSEGRRHPAVISSTQATSWRRLRTSKTWSQWGA